MSQKKRGSLAVEPISLTEAQNLSFVSAFSLEDWLGAGVVIGPNEIGSTAKGKKMLWEAIRRRNISAPGFDPVANAVKEIQKMVEEWHKGARPA